MDKYQLEKGLAVMKLCGNMQAEEVSCSEGMSSVEEMWMRNIRK